MGTNINSTASILVKNVGKNLQGESLDAGATLGIKRKINDVTYSGRITEATVMNVGAFKGAWLSLSKPLGVNSFQDYRVPAVFLQQHSASSLCGSLVIVN
jgi:hypothetical protein